MVENKLINGYEPALVRLYGARDSVEISEQMAAALCGNRILALGREALQLAQDPVGLHGQQLRVPRTHADSV
jgi:hypothetical protein